MTLHSEKPVFVLRHVTHVPLGSLEDVFAEHDVEFVYIDLFDKAPQRLPLEEASALVVLGGPMNADQTGAYPFLETELGWIRSAIERRMPLLGICLGAQLMAKALGKRVAANRVKEIGWYDLQVLAAAEEDPLFSGSQPVETAFEWHGDTFDLPDGAVLLARSENCENQAFRVGPCAWALQFHVEMTESLIEQWMADAEFAAEVAALHYIDADAIRAGIPQKLPAMQAFTHRVLGRFARLCR